MTTIIVIEDDAQNARLVSKVLRNSDFDVLLAEDGESGLNLASETTPDLMLVDLGLPDMDGQTVVAMLKQLTSLEHVPIIAFTAWPEATATQMAQAYGCQGIITKPINTRTLVDQINKFLAATQPE